ncbi:hypothetical protein OFL47_22710, partial [Pseudomonas aeruginosa]|nr:hypothetical protein [Pseudomonas aeruginosa]
MARKISYQQAINEALAQEMRRDPSVFIMGEDNAGGAGAPGEDDAWGGVLGVTKGLYHQFPGRVLDTPLSEIGYVGAPGRPPPPPHGRKANLYATIGPSDRGGVCL